LTPAVIVCCAWSVALVGGLVLAPARPELGALAIGTAFATAALGLVMRPLVVPIALLAACLGLARAELPVADPGAAARAVAFAGRQVVVDGVVADDPRDQAGGYEALIQPTQVLSEGGTLPAIGNILVRVHGPGSVAFGDEVTVGGILRLPANQPGFDRRAYLAVQHAYVELVAREVSIVNEGAGPGRLAGWLRRSYVEAIGELMPAPHAQVLVGVVLGVRAGIPPRLNQDLIATGLVHLLVLSGLKVAVFSRLAIALLEPLLGRFSTLPTLALIGLYALTGGATPAAVRAAAMGGVALLGRRQGRPTHVWTSLAVTGAAMLGWRPELAWDVGFQLSFAGTAAIIVLTPAIERRLRAVPHFLREPFAVTCAAQVGTVPLMATDFHLLSPVGPIANAVVLPALPAIVLTGLLTAPLAAVPDVGRLVVLPLTGLLAYVEQVASLLARAPAAAISVASFPRWAGLAYYLGLSGAIGAAAGDGRKRVAAVVIGVAGPLLVGGGELALAAGGGPAVTILDVGDGQAVLLQGPGGTVLIDGGGSPTRLHDELGSRLPPWQSDLEALVVTAPGAAHVGGLAGWNRHVREVLLPATPMAGTAWRSAALAAVTAGAQVRRLTAGDVVSVAGIRLEVLAPEPTDPGDQNGAGYLAFRAVGPAHSFCDLSDLDPDAQIMVAGRLRGPCDYVLLPSGARSSLAPELLAAAGPGQLIASTAPGRLARDLPPTTLRTDQEGAIELPL
jgi:competence protein ComEC